MDGYTMSKFIKAIARSHGIEVKSNDSGSKISVPLRSHIDPRIVFEFCLSRTKRLKMDDVAIHLCVEENNNMQRISTLYLNGLWKGSVFEEEIRMYINNNMPNVYAESEEKYLERALTLQVVEEEFFPSLEAEEAAKYSARLLQ